MHDSSNRKTILIVDDSPEIIGLLNLILTPQYNVKASLTGKKALEIANKHPQPDLIILDIRMPNMDGFEVCKKLKANENSKHIQIIFLTASTEHKTVARGLALGAYYYLTKPIDRTTINAVVQSALNESEVLKTLKKKLKQTENTLTMLVNGKFQYRTLEQAHQLTTLLANQCPEPDKRVTGLTELLVNAVEHGNLGISYEQKSLLNANDQWLQEVEKRLSLPEYSRKVATVRFEKNEREICFVIKDQGSGFKWNDYLQLDTSRATHSHGRGIALANMISFDQLQYQGIGNEVIAKIKL